MRKRYQKKTKPNKIQTISQKSESGKSENTEIANLKRLEINAKNKENAPSLLIAKKTVKKDGIQDNNNHREYHSNNGNNGNHGNISTEIRRVGLKSSITADINSSFLGESSEVVSSTSSTPTLLSNNTTVETGERGHGGDKGGKGGKGGKGDKGGKGGGSSDVIGTLSPSALEMESIHSLSHSTSHSKSSPTPTDSFSPSLSSPLLSTRSTDIGGWGDVHEDSYVREERERRDEREREGRERVENEEEDGPVFTINPMGENAEMMRKQKKTDRKNGKKSPKSDYEHYNDFQDSYDDNYEGNYDGPDNYNEEDSPLFMDNPMISTNFHTHKNKMRGGNTEEKEGEEE